REPRSRRGPGGAAVHGLGAVRPGAGRVPVRRRAAVRHRPVPADARAVDALPGRVRGHRSRDGPGSRAHAVVAPERRDPGLVAGVAMSAVALLALLALGDAGAPEPVLVPPAPIEMPAIAAPAGALPPGAPVEVEVILTIDEHGQVIDVQVTRSGGAALDSAVTSGVRRFRFQPALRDGAPFAVRIPF